MPVAARADIIYSMRNEVTLSLAQRQHQACLSLQSQVNQFTRPRSSHIYGKLPTVPNTIMTVCFLGLTRVGPANCISIRSAVFAYTAAKASNAFHWGGQPQILLLPFGDRAQSNTYVFLGLPKLVPQTVSQSGGTRYSDTRYSDTYMDAGFRELRIVLLRSNRTSNRIGRPPWFLTGERHLTTLW